MANPAARYAHSSEQMLDVLREIPPAVRDRISRLLSERDTSIENAINAGLRKEASQAAFGDGTSVGDAPAYSLVDGASVIYEKQHDVSHLEISGTVAGLGTVSGVIVLIAAAIWPDDDGSTPPGTEVFLGQWKLGAQLGAYTAFGNTSSVALGAGRYNVQLACAVVAGGGFDLIPESVNSIRVVESLY